MTVKALAQSLESLEHLTSHILHVQQSNAASLPARPPRASFEACVWRSKLALISTPSRMHPR